MGMGVRLYTPSGSDDTLNPDPYNFKLLGAVAINQVTVAEVLYPGCSNYEGRKLLLLNLSWAEVVALKKLDPHFSEDGPLIARFKPTK
jgi:hypothetical protein